MFASGTKRGNGDAPKGRCRQRPRYVRKRMSGASASWTKAPARGSAGSSAAGVFAVAAAPARMFASTTLRQSPRVCSTVPIESTAAGCVAAREGAARWRAGDAPPGGRGAGEDLVAGPRETPFCGGCGRHGLRVGWSGRVRLAAKAGTPGTMIGRVRFEGCRTPRMGAPMTRSTEARREQPGSCSRARCQACPTRR
jgi:hypothetical protein